MVEPARDRRGAVCGQVQVEESLHCRPRLLKARSTRRCTARSTADGADLATLALIGDASAALGKPAEAERYYEAAEQFAVTNAEPFNRQWTLFRLDHGRHIEETLALLQEEVTERPDVYGWDQLAWALYRAGRYSEARDAMSNALRLGTRDAALFFHAGLIERALGSSEMAQRRLRDALETSPYFHPTFPAWARAVLDSIARGR